MSGGDRQGERTGTLYQVFSRLSPGSSLRPSTAGREPSQAVPHLLPRKGDPGPRHLTRLGSKEELFWSLLPQEPELGRSSSPAGSKETPVWLSSIPLHPDMPNSKTVRLLHPTRPSIPSLRRLLYLSAVTTSCLSVCPGRVPLICQNTSYCAHLVHGPASCSHYV